MRSEGAKRRFVGRGVDIPPEDISVPRQKIGQLVSILGVVMDFDADPTRISTSFHKGRKHHVFARFDIELEPAVGTYNWPDTIHGDAALRVFTDVSRVGIAGAIVERGIAGPEPFAVALRVDVVDVEISREEFEIIRVRFVADQLGVGNDAAARMENRPMLAPPSIISPGVKLGHS
jgi:hypothetical protein